MKLISVREITIPSTRQRATFEPAAMNELRESMEKHGLFHPIVLRTEGDHHVLVSGERRLRAAQDIWELGGQFTCDERAFAGPEVPFVFLGELDQLAAEEAEFDENTKRADYTWQERAAATSRLENIRRRIAERDGLPPPSVADLSVAIRGSKAGYHHEATRRELIVAQHLDDPDVAAAESVDDAYKTLKRKEAAGQNAALAESIGRVFSSASHAALNEDALAWLAQAPAESFDVILTDPPYGMGADEFGDSGGRVAGAHGYTDDAASFTRILSVCQTELFRVAKLEAHLYWFCDIDQFHVAREAFSANGWWVHRTPIIWHKPSSIRVPWPTYGPQRKWEMLLYAVKGKRPVFNIAPDLVSFPSDINLGHGAQKPVALFLDLLRRSVRPGDTVLDPFAGTGTIFPAAHELKCAATGIELDPTSYGIALKRLQGLDAEPELPL